MACPLYKSVQQDSIGHYGTISYGLYSLVFDSNLTKTKYSAIEQVTK